MNFTFFLSTHGTFSRIDHILAHKSSLGKLKKIEIIPSIFSDHDAVRLDLNYRRKTIKNSNIWRLNNTLLNNQQITEEIKICIETNENENTKHKTCSVQFSSVTQSCPALCDPMNRSTPVGPCKSSAKGKVHSNRGIPQETRKKSNKEPNSTPKATNKGRNEEPQGW